MKARIENKEVNPGLLQLPDMNYGQMQRWKDFVPLKYEFEIKRNSFLSSTSEFFSEFRKLEIKEDDTEGFPELEEYKKIGWPDLNILISEHPTLLEKLLLFNQYELLGCFVIHPIPKSNYYYSLNSVESVSFNCESVIITGICFQLH